MIVVVLGFKRNRNYDSVLRKELIPFLKKKETQIELLVVSGWQGEAEGLAVFLREEGLNLNIRLETQACRTFENIKFSFEIFKQLNLVPKEVIFIGEESSEMKVTWLAPKFSKRIFHSSIPFEFLPLPLLKSAGKEPSQFKMLLDLWLDKVSYYCPPISGFLTFLRKKHII